AGVASASEVGAGRLLMGRRLLPRGSRRWQGRSDCATVPARDAARAPRRPGTPRPRPAALALAGGGPPNGPAPRPPYPPSPRGLDGGPVRPRAGDAVALRRRPRPRAR